MAAKRFQTDEKVEFEIYGKSGVFSAKLKNLSSSGAKIEMTDSFTGGIDRGEILHIRVVLDTLKKVRQFDAEIRWKSRRDMGLKFMRRDDVVSRIFKKVF